MNLHTNTSFKNPLFPLSMMRNAADDIDNQRLRLVELADKASEIIATADAENRQMTADEGSTVDSLNNEFEHIQGEIAKREKVQAMREHVGRPVNVQAEPPPLPGDLVAMQPQNNQHRRNGILLPRNAANAAELIFGRPRAAQGSNPEAFFRALAHRMPTADMLRNAVGSEGSGVDGGFAVPQEWFSGLVDQALQAASFAPLCRIYPTSTAGLILALPDYQNRQNDLAGLDANWVSEGATSTAQRLRYRQVTIACKKILLRASATSELAEDGLNYSVQLQNALTVAAAYTLDNAILDGNGVQAPLGILHDPSAIQVAPESGQAADTINFLNITAMYSRLSPACQRNGVWFVSPSVLPQLLTMTFPTAGGSTVPVLLGSNGQSTNSATAEPIGTIFGRPVITTEICKPLGDAGDIVFCDLSQFALVVRNSARIELSNSPGFAEDVLDWRFRWRVGGCGQWNAPITPYTGGQTLGWASFLTARA